MNRREQPSRPDTGLHAWTDFVLAELVLSENPDGSKPGQFIKPVEGSCLVAFRQRGVVEYRIDEIVDRASEDHYGLSDMQ